MCEVESCSAAAAKKPEVEIVHAGPSSNRVEYIRSEGLFSSSTLYSHCLSPLEF